VAPRALHRQRPLAAGGPRHRSPDWLSAYDFITDKGAVALNDYARASDPFGKVGKIQVAIDISSVIRASNDSFRVTWTERRYEKRASSRLSDGPPS
jgi:type IV secretory pathway TrbF-like protein